MRVEVAAAKKHSVLFGVSYELCVDVPKLVNDRLSLVRGIVNIQICCRKLNKVSNLIKLKKVSLTHHKMLDRCGGQVGQASCGRQQLMIIWGNSRREKLIAA